MQGAAGSRQCCRAGARAGALRSEHRRGALCVARRASDTALYLLPSLRSVLVPCRASGRVHNEAGTARSTNQISYTHGTRRRSSGVEAGMEAAAAAAHAQPLFASSTGL